jgi:hypothetical protein
MRNWRACWACALTRGMTSEARAVFWKVQVNKREDREDEKSNGHNGNQNQYNPVGQSIGAFARAGLVSCRSFKRALTAVHSEIPPEINLMSQYLRRRMQCVPHKGTPFLQKRFQRRCCRCNTRMSPGPICPGLTLAPALGSTLRSEADIVAGPQCGGLWGAPGAHSWRRCARRNIGHRYYIERSRSSLPPRDRCPR